MIAFAKKLGEWLDGKKTHASIALLLIWVLVYLKVPGAKEAIGSENFQAVLAALGAAAGISFRSAVAKVEGDEDGDGIPDNLQRPPATPPPSSGPSPGAGTTEKGGAP